MNAPVSLRTERLVAPEKSAHWYYPSGRTCHEVPRSDGKGMRSTTVRDARKLGLLPSVTTILGILAKPGLEAWKQEQAILAALTLPRAENESDEVYARRVAGDAKREACEAANLGTRIHSACLDRLDDADLRGYVDTFEAFLEKYGFWKLWAEKKLVSIDYAGTADLLCTDGSEGEVLIDLKTQNVKNGKPFWHEDWICQLAAYDYCIDHADRRLANLIIDRANQGKYYYREYTSAERKRGFEIFIGAKRVWKLLKNYDPASE